MRRKFQPVLYVLLSLLWAGSSQAQEWVEKMKDPEVPFKKAQKSFEKYWKGDTGPGWKQFKRWEWFMESRSSSGKRIPASARWEAWKEMKGPRGGGGSAGDWDYIGNDDIPTYGGAGRINSIALHPDDQTTVFAGAASGGLWKSTDDGSTWEHMTDHEPVLGVSRILIHPEDPDTMYIATGDGDGADTYSIGVLKSTDGGNTWSTVGWNNITQSDRIRIFHLVMNQEDPSTLLASTDQGLYKSSNGGSDWKQVASGRFGDIEYHPTDTSIVYTIDADDHLFMRSTDGGNSFSAVLSGTPPQNDVGRMEIGVSPDDPSRVYFIAGDASTQGFYGLYRSDDAGQSFFQTANSPNLLGYSADGSGSGGQAWYDLAIAVSPKNADYVYTGGINIWRSTDGGYSFDIKTHWWGDQNLPEVHADQHHLSFDQNGRLWAGNDGGVFRSPLVGDQWTDLSDGLHIAQIYRLGQAEQDAELIITGWQDNGTNLRNAPATWYRVIGGDGMECVISHSDPSIMYGTIYYGQLYRSTDKGSSFSKIVYSDSSNSVHESGGWVTPYTMNPQNSDALIIGKKELYRTMDGGDTWSQFSSGMGTGNFQTIGRCESAPDHIYAAKRSELWKKDGSGTSFQSRDNGLPVSQLSITHVEAHKGDPNQAWVTFSGYQSAEKVYYTDDGGVTWANRSNGLPNVPVNCVVHEPGTQRVYVGTDLGVYYREDGMAEFKPFNKGLPNVIVNELAIHNGAQKLRAASYGRGLWESELRGDEPTSIEARSQNGSLEVYPNPSKGQLNGKLEGELGTIQLDVRDAAGRSVHQVEVNGDRERFRLDLGQLESGLYFLHFRMEDETVTRKVMLR